MMIDLDGKTSCDGAGNVPEVDGGKGREMIVHYLSLRLYCTFL
jgi:hypothetical protein